MAPITADPNLTDLDVASMILAPASIVGGSVVRYHAATSKTVFPHRNYLRVTAIMAATSLLYSAFRPYFSAKPLDVDDQSLGNLSQMFRQGAAITGTLSMLLGSFALVSLSSQSPLRVHLNILRNITLVPAISMSLLHYCARLTNGTLDLDDSINITMICLHAFPLI